MAFTYILLCADDSYYVGCTEDLEQRLKQHQSGNGGQYTHIHRPVKLDTGTHDSLSEASTYIEVLEKRQGLKVA